MEFTYQIFTSSFIMLAHVYVNSIHVRTMQEPPEYKLMGYTPMPFPDLNSYRPPGLVRKLKQGAMVSDSH